VIFNAKTSLIAPERVDHENKGNEDTVFFNSGNFIEGEEKTPS
jgi:hypothetical protein